MGPLVDVHARHSIICPALLLSVTSTVGISTNTACLALLHPVPGTMRHLVKGRSDVLVHHLYVRLVD